MSRHSSLFRDRLRGCWLAAITVLVLAPGLSARVTQIVVTKIESPTFGGASFGSVGQYELIQGTITGEIDPNNPQNAVIADIALAPRNSRRMVTYSSDFQIIRPINLAAGNHRILFDLPIDCHRSYIHLFSPFRPHDVGVVGAVAGLSDDDHQAPMQWVLVDARDQPIE